MKKMFALLLALSLLLTAVPAFAAPTRDTKAAEITVDDNLTYLMIPNPETDKADLPKVEESIREKMDAMFKDNFTYHFEWVDEIPADPNGKLRIILCKVDA